MKRLSAILLLSCIGLYQFGFFIADFWVGKHIEKKWSTEILAEQVNLDNSFILKVPISVPYMPDDQDFKVVNSSYEENGRHYRVIEQRYRNDTLELRVVSDAYKSTLDTIIKDWISNSMAAAQSDAIGKIPFKNISKEYNFYQFSLKPKTTYLLDNELKAGTYLSPLYANPKLDFPSEPPELS